MDRFYVEVIATHEPQNYPNLEVVEYHVRDGYAHLVVTARSFGEAARMTARRVFGLDDDELIAVTKDGADYRYYASDGSAIRGYA